MDQVSIQLTHQQVAVQFQMFLYLYEELRATMFRHGAKWNEYTDITGLLIYG